MNTRAERDAEFAAFVAGNQDRLLRLALVLTGDRGGAQDLVQTALTRAYSRWPRIWDQDPFAYTRRIIVNANHDRWRRDRGREQLEAAPGTDRGSVRDDASEVADRDAIVRAVGELTLKERRVVVLRFLADMSEAETARELGLAPGTVKSTTHRAMTKLRNSRHLSDVPQETP